MITLNGNTAHSCVVYAHETGCWTAEVQCDADSMSGKVTLDLEGVEFICSVIKAQRDQAWLHVELQGGAGWSKELPPKAYAVNDAGTKVQLIVEDLARSVGETLGSIELGTPRLGPQHTRPAGRASVSLQEALRGTNWYVDYSGVTQIGARPSRTLTSDAFTLLGYKREAHEAIVSVDAADAILPGDVIEHELVPEGFRVKSLTLRWDPSVLLQMTLKADDDMDVVSLIQRIVALQLQEKLYGVYEYQVAGQSGQKLDLQPIRTKLMPSLARVPIWPGIPGAKMTIPTGMRCLVIFKDGDRSNPVVINFVDAADGNFEPDLVTLTCELKVEGEVTAKSNSPTEKVGLTSHITPTPVGPSSPPQGGT